MWAKLTIFKQNKLTTYSSEIRFSATKKPTFLKGND